MTPAEWSGLLVAVGGTLLSFAVAWGVSMARLSAIERRVSILEGRIDSQQRELLARIDKLSAQVAYLNGQLAARGLSVPPAHED